MSARFAVAARRLPGFRPCCKCVTTGDRAGEWCKCWQKTKWTFHLATNCVSVSWTAHGADKQRPADNLFGLMKFDNDDDKENFKMSCGYCHQIGTAGFRSPEEPVDWETMITRMDGFGGLYKHTQETIVNRIVNTYSPAAMKEWPAFVPPPAPKGAATKATITEWDIGRQDACMIHDLELGKDGKVYAVDMTNDAIYSLDPATGERKTITIDRKSVV